MVEYFPECFLRRKKKPEFLTVGPPAVHSISAMPGGVAERMLNWMVEKQECAHERYSWSFSRWIPVENGGGRVSVGVVKIKQPGGENVERTVTLRVGGKQIGLCLADVNRPTFSIREKRPFCISIGNGSAGLVPQMIEAILRTWVIQGEDWLKITRKASDRRREKKKARRRRAKDDYC